MNLLALMWLERQIKRIEYAELRRLAAELRDLNKETQQLREAFDKRKRERMRQDGQTGFVMVEKKYRGKK